MTSASARQRDSIVAIKGAMSLGPSTFLMRGHLRSVIEAIHFSEVPESLQPVRRYSESGWPPSPPFPRYHKADSPVRFSKRGDGHGNAIGIDSNPLLRIPSNLIASRFPTPSRLFHCSILSCSERTAPEEQAGAARSTDRRETRGMSHICQCTTRSGVLNRGCPWMRLVLQAGHGVAAARPCVGRATRIGPSDGSQVVAGWKKGSSVEGSCPRGATGFSKGLRIGCAGGGDALPETTNGFVNREPSFIADYRGGVTCL